MTRFPKEFYLVTGLATMAFISSTIISPFFSLFLSESGVSLVELGLVMSVMSYTTLVTRMPLGLVTNRVGIWWVIPLALFGQSLSYILYTFVTNITYFYLIRIFHALALASLNPTLMSLVSTFSPEGRKGEAVGTYLTSVGLAAMCGPFLCSLLLYYFNYRTILILSSIIPLIAFIIYLRLLRTNIFRDATKANRHEAPHTSSWISLNEVISLKPVQMITYIRFTFAFTMSVITTLYAVYAVNTLKINPSVYALLITLKGLTNTLVRVPAGKISDVIGRKKPLLLSFILLTMVFLLFSEVKDPIMISFAMLLYGLAHGIRAVNEWSLLVDVVPRENINLANFYLPSVFDLGTALGATFAGSAATILSTQTILRTITILISSSIFVVAFNRIPLKKEHE